LERYAEDTSSRLLWLALAILDVADPQAREAARHVGIAWSLVGSLRALPHHAKAGRHTLPAALGIAHGLDPESCLALRPSPALSRIASHVADRARQHLEAARA